MMSRKSWNTLLFPVLAIAIIFFSTNCKVSHLRANYHFSKANGLFSDAKYREAIDHYEKAISFNPELVDAYRFLGESYKELYQPGRESERNQEVAQRALETLTRAYETYPNNLEIIYSLGDMHDKLDNFKEAEKYYKKILELEPTDIGNFYILASFYKRYAGSQEEGVSNPYTDEMGRTPGDKAVQMYFRRIELDPESQEGYAYIAQYYEKIEPIPEFEKAIEIHKKRLELDPDNALIYYSMGVTNFMFAFRLQNILSREERMIIADEAEKALKKSMELDDDYADTYAFLNMLYRNVHANLYPEKYDRYIAEADRLRDRSIDLRKRAVERRRLKEELKKTEDITK